MNRLRVAIDGPAGAGKSTVARRVADALGLLYVDSGAMYRAVTWWVLERGIDPDDEVALSKLADEIRLELRRDGLSVRVWVNGRDVTPMLRSPQVNRAVSAVAKVPAVRRRMTELQKEWAARGGVVMDGRDIGTAVMPDAEVKVYLTASLAERTRRRMEDLQQRGHCVSAEEVRTELAERDLADAHRAVSPLVRAPDAHLIDTTGRDVESVVAEILALCRPFLSEEAWPGG